ncbi:MAG: putative toxin-antitoxin system toxin component, PIN family [Cytophagaceae bacterium]|nr:MAG: putative toxin-antitoxin system toxin component, PIN family [Cytophagaceae bacterium]
MRVVIDTNDFISALIGKSHREKLATVLKNQSIDLFADEVLLNEIREVANRPKFQRYVSPETVNLFIATITQRLTLIKPTTTVTDSPDPDDNYLLALAIDAKADYLVTGDKKHLLALNPYKGISIIRLQTLLDSL